MIARRIADFGTWDSALSAALIFEKRQTYSQPVPWENGVLFLLTMPTEQNALALMHCDRTGEVSRVSPPGFSLRTRVHEYGGLPFGFSWHEVYYCNFKDQEIYRQRFNPDTQHFDAPVQVTHSEPNQVRYCDLVVDSQRQRLICVREDHRQSSDSPSAVINALVAISLSGPAPATPQEQLVLFEKSDFVTSPTLSPDSTSISFVTWSHPNMPWDNTELRVAQFDEQGALAQLLEVDRDQAGAKAQPSFDLDNNLYFLTDTSNYWNLVKVASADLREGCCASVVYAIDADCCGPAWETGKRNYCVVGNSDLIISVVRDCHWQLHRVHLLENRVDILATHLGQLEQIRCVDDQHVSFLAATTDDYASIYRIDLHANAAALGSSTLVKAPVPKELAPALVSLPEHFQFSSHGSALAFGLLYRPKSDQFDGPTGQLPPLLVNVHGGPTGTARAALNPMHQFWTSRGFAVLDLNHRGSSGYGRKFRQLLYGQWGVVDIEDIVAAVHHLIDNELVAPDKIAIRGGSAGGYAVLASLAASDLFAAGVSYYGVSDLELLARDTHKFESRYLDQLIGPYPQAKAIYQARSPINSLEKIEAPILILQGDEDKVVPPNQASVIYEKLRSQNPATELIRFAGEGHGFRLAENQICALETELSFYQRNLLGMSES